MNRERPRGGRLRAELAVAALIPGVPGLPDGFQNGGFEEDPPTRGWTVQVYGAPAEILLNAAPQLEYLCPHHYGARIWRPWRRTVRSLRALVSGSPR